MYVILILTDDFVNFSLHGEDESTYLDSSGMLDWVRRSVFVMITSTGAESGLGVSLKLQKT